MSLLRYASQNLKYTSKNHIVVQVHYLSSEVRAVVVDQQPVLLKHVRRLVVVLARLPDQMVCNR